MGKETSIQWTDVTWNIARGCSKVDADCKFCYMYRDSFDGKRYNPREVVRTKTVFNLPLKIKEPSRIFTSSLTDVFHEAIDPYRSEMWDIIRKCPQHTFQILTKRPERITDHLPSDWGDGWNNVWLGTSIGSQAAIQRVFDLIAVKAKTKFLSIEPLHTEVSFRWLHVPANWRETKGSVSHLEILKHIQWVIIGGESGHETGLYRYRPCELQWIENIVDQCREAKVSLFIKQMGTHLSKKLGMSDRHGGNIDEFPEHLRIREFP